MEEGYAHEGLLVATGLSRRAPAAPTWSQVLGANVGRIFTTSSADPSSTAGS